MNKIIGETVKIEKAGYSLELSEKTITVFLDGEQVSALRPESSVNLLINGEVREGEPEITGFFRDGDRFIWTDKERCEYILTVFDDRFEYYIKVKGSGKVFGVDYFSGNKNVPNPGSEYEFDRGFMPIPTITGARQCEFPAQESYDEFSYLTIPPLFCYVFDICGVNEKLCFALAAEKGHHNFTKFTYTTKSDNFLRRFWLSTDQSGHESFQGEWISPKILVFGAPDRETALKYYSDYYFANGLSERKAKETPPRFWYGPIACGWIEQAAYSMKHNLGLGAQELACEKLYNNFMSEMKRRNLHPQILIIDDKWQKEYGTAVADTEKWPDLRGWIDRNLQENNCRTMLWYKLWDAEGLPDDCTMYDEKENRRVADPTNPKYRALLRENLHRLLSSDQGCYNAYGLKLDFAFFQPVGEKSESYSGLYGVELYYEYVKFIYECVKEIKPEAVVSGSPCHPYFNKYIDHGRLHDYFPDLRRCFEEFRFRAMLYKTALPDAVIDTDGSSFHSRRDTMRHLTMAHTIGVPDLYCITPMPSLELSDSDWDKVAKVWSEYSEEIDKRYNL
ncbi:MAG: hypothetical protein PUC29_04850 [Clostridia bacterium]|nr:hypothetical protein [Clostridia bacterium]